MNDLSCAEVRELGAELALGCCLAMRGQRLLPISNTVASAR